MTESDDSLAVPRPAAPVPITDPHALKEATLRDYTRNAGLFGMPTETADIERLALQDLQLADAFRRDEGPPREAKKESAEERRERHRRDAQRIGAETGTTLIHDTPREWGPRLDLPPEIGLSEKWALAKGRMVRVMEGATVPPVKHPDGTIDFRATTSTCGFPVGAYQFLSNWFDLDCRGVFETRRHNSYFGMSHRDASLKFVADTMSICDASSGRFGPWFVPK